MTGRPKTRARKESQQRNAVQRQNPAYIERTIEQKIQAVVAARVAGQDHPLGKAGLEAASRVIGAPIVPSTLKRWIDEYDEAAHALLPALQPDLQRAAQEAYNITVEHMKSAMVKLAVGMDDAVGIASAPIHHRSVAFGVIFDKMLKLQGLSPEHTQAMQRFVAKCQVYGEDPIGLLDDMIAIMEHKQPVTVGSSSNPPG